MFLFPKEALLISNQTHFYSSSILVCTLNEMSGKRTNCVFVLNVWNSLQPLQFIQSTACMSLGDFVGHQLESQHMQRSTSLGFYCRTWWRSSGSWTLNEVWSCGDTTFSEQTIESESPDLRARRRYLEGRNIEIIWLTTWSNLVDILNYLNLI